VALIIFSTGNLKKVSALTSNTLSFQGKIVRNDSGSEGINVSNSETSCIVAGADSCKFKASYYDDSSGTTLLGSETFSNVELGDNEGVFNLIFGSQSFTSGAVSSFEEIFSEGYDDVHVQVEFAPDGSSFSEDFGFMGMRASAYAMNSNNLGGLDKNGFVQLGLNIAQVDSSANTSIFINNTGGGSLLNLQNGGSSALFVGSNGRVGVGSTNPRSKLHVVSLSQAEYSGADSAYTNSNLILHGNESGRTIGSGPSLTFAIPANTDGSNIWEQARILATPDNTSNGNAKGRLYLQVRDSYTPSGGSGTWNWRTGLMINSLGNIGIGTDNPNSKLHIVQSNEKGLTFSRSGHETMMIGLEGATGLAFRNVNDGNVPFYIHDNGNIGIGTVSPETALDIKHSSSVTFQLESLSDSNYYTQLKQNYAEEGFNLNIGGTNIISTFGYYDADSLSIGVKNFEDALHLDNSGNLGIGTTTPSQKLEVSGNSLVTGNTYIGNVDTYFYRDTANRIATPDDFYIQPSSGNTYLYSTNTYLGSTSGDYIRVRDNQLYGDDWFINYNALGNWGIGTTTPTYKLDVNGTARFSDHVRMDSGKNISFYDHNGTYPTATGGFTWDLNSDNAKIYAQQPSNDRIDFVFKLDDNVGSSDRFVYWIDSYTGETDDAYPLLMDGTKTVFNYPTVFGTGTSKNIDFYIMGNAQSSTSNAYFFGDASTSRIGINDTTPDHSLDVNGNIGLSNSNYINWGDTDGDLGYGFWDDAGTLKFKNNSGSWATFNNGPTTFLGLTDTISSYANGSVLFTSATTVTQDNANLFWDNTNNRLGVGTTLPLERLDISGRIYIANDTAPSTTTNRLYAVGGDLYWNGSKLGSGGTQKIVLEAEYEGAVLSGDGSNNVGSMYADNTGSTNNWMNYYNWSSSETALNDYDVRVRFTLPSDFISWDTNAITFDYSTQTTSTADNQLNISLYLETSATEDTTSTSNVSSTAGVWNTATISSTNLTDCNSADETCVLIIQLQSKNDNYVKIGDITLSYNN